MPHVNVPIFNLFCWCKCCWLVCLLSKFAAPICAVVCPCFEAVLVMIFCSFNSPIMLFWTAVTHLKSSDLFLFCSKNIAEFGAVLQQNRGWNAAVWIRFIVVLNLYFAAVLNLYLAAVLSQCWCLFVVVLLLFCCCCCCFGGRMLLNWQPTCCYF